MLGVVPGFRYTSISIAYLIRVSSLIYYISRLELVLIVPH